MRVIRGALRVLPAIQLNDDARLGARKIGDVAADRHLAPEAQALQLPAAQETPQGAFGVRGTVPEDAGATTQQIQANPSPTLPSLREREGGAIPFRYAMGGAAMYWTLDRVGRIV